MLLSQAIAFCASVPHAEALARMLESEGIRAETVHGNMIKADRERVLRHFREGEAVERQAGNAGSLSSIVSQPESLSLRQHPRADELQRADGGLRRPGLRHHRHVPAHALRRPLPPGHATTTAEAKS